MNKDTYKTIDERSIGYFKDKGSKFYAYAYPLAAEDQVKPIITQLKKEHHNARHHCYAWRLGTDIIKTRANDDGEPSSTAGKPILGQLQSFDVTNILVVVVRYFGGTLLGVSGLINAYKNAAAEALNNAAIHEKIIEELFQLKFEYPMLNTVMQMLKKESLHVVETDFKESCKLIFSARKSEAERIKSIFSNLYGVELDKRQ